MTLKVLKGQTAVWQNVDEAVPFREELEQSLAALNGQGHCFKWYLRFVWGEYFFQGIYYQLHLYNPVVSISHDTLKSWGIGVGFS